MENVHGRWQTGCLWVVSTTLACSLVWGQADVPAESLRSVSGRVIDAQTDQPIPNAPVRCAQVETPATRTDVHGEFDLQKLPAVCTSIAVWSLPGYASGGMRIDTAGSQTVRNLVIRVDRMAAIAGRVMLDRDRPAANATVSVFTTGYVGGLPNLTSFRSVSTDAQGRYRATGMGPGSYRLAVHQSGSFQDGPSQLGSEEKFLDAPLTSAHVRSFFPESPTMDGAVPIQLRPGDVREDVDLFLPPEPTACIRTRVQGNPGDGIISVWLVETWLGHHFTLAHGRFEPGSTLGFCGLPRGSYRLLAFRRTEDASAAHSEAFSTTNRNLVLRDIVLEPTRSQPGRVTMEGDSKQPADGGAQKIVVIVRPAERGAFMVEGLDSPVQADGAFELPGLINDTYWLEVAGLSRNQYVRHATAGLADAWQKPFMPGSPIEIVIAEDGASLFGTVKNSQEEPVNDAVIFVVREEQKQEVRRIQRTVFPNHNGKFEIRSLPPGAYLVAVVSRALGASFHGRDLYEQVAPLARRVDLKPGSSTSLTLTVP